MGNRIITYSRYHNMIIVSIILLITVTQVLITVTQAFDGIEHVFERSVTYSRSSFNPGEDHGGLYTRAREPDANKTQQQTSLKYEDQLSSTSYETILNLGKDGRTRVRESTKWPNSVHTQLAIFFENKEYGGSGVMVGPHHVLTCGHNVFDTERNVWANSIKVHPALNDKVAPFGTINVVKAFTFRAWTQSADHEYDLALLVLEQSIGSYTGWGGMLSYSDQDLKSLEVSITGYPGDKGFKQLWTMKHKLRMITPEKFSYEIDTFGGQSGSPIWAFIKGDPCIVGIHTRGGKNENFGVRISPNKLKNYIARWIENTYEIETSFSIPPISGYPLLTQHPGRSVDSFPLFSSSYSSYRAPLTTHRPVSSLFVPQTSTNGHQFLDFLSVRVPNETEDEGYNSDPEIKNEGYKPNPEKDLTTLLQEVGFSRGGIKDGIKMARHFLKKLCSVETKKSVAEALNVSTSTLSNFIEGRESPTIINNLTRALKEKKGGFFETAQEAAQTQKPKKRKLDSKKE